MINIIEDKGINIIRKELIRRGIVEDIALNPKTNTAIIKANIEVDEATLLATKAMMALATNRYGNVKVEVIK